MSYMKSILLVLLLMISSCKTKLPDGFNACSDNINTNCYLEVMNKKECFVRFETYSGETEVKWSGNCVNHLVEGDGSLSTKMIFPAVSIIVTTGTMKKGKFVGKRTGSVKDETGKEIMHLVETDDKFDIMTPKDSNKFFEWHYKKSTECKADYINCWKGTYSRSEGYDRLYLVGYMYDPKPYKGRSIRYGVLYWRNTCSEVEWKGKAPVPSRKIQPPLIDAIKKLQYRRLKSLLADNHPVDFADKNGKTPLMYAVSKNGAGNEIFTGMLLKHGADITKKDKNGKTVYDHIIKHKESGNFRTMLDNVRDGKKSPFRSFNEYVKTGGDPSLLPELRKKQKEEDKKNSAKETK